MEIRSNAFNAPKNHRLDITLPNRESIAAGKPDPVSPEDVRARGAEQRQIAKERIEGARDKAQQLAERAKNARSIRSERIANARSLRAERSEGARRQAVAAPADEARPVDLERAERPAVSQAERAADVRAAQLAERAQGAREHRADRIGNARDQVELSETSMRVRARGSERAQLASEKAQRLHELRGQFEAGTLNTDELIAKAAFKMLSGEGQ